MGSEMEESKHTPGPWLREGTFVYALQHHGWRKGEETFCNRFSAGLSLGPGCSEEELIANATLAQAAPDLLAELQNIANANPSSWDEETRDQFQQWAQNRARAAIAKVTGSKP
jgi:hypothetical protein